jgi:hypothetical protein
MITSALEQARPLHWLFEKARGSAAPCSGTLSQSATETGRQNDRSRGRRDQACEMAVPPRHQTRI